MPSSSVLIRVALFAALVPITTSASSAQAIVDPQQALREAVSARDEAIVALKKANDAIERASQALRQAHSSSEAPLPVTQVASTNSRKVILPLCVVDAGAPDRLLAEAGSYSSSCLKKTDTTDLRVTGLLQGESAAIIVARTGRILKTTEAGKYRNTYHRTRVGFTKAKENDAFAIFDVGSSGWQRGWGRAGGL